MSNFELFLLRMTYAASAIMSGFLLPAAPSPCVNISIAAVQIAVRGHRAFTAMPSCR